MLFVKLQTLLFATLLIITKYSTKAASADTSSLVVTATEFSENKKLQKEDSTNENTPKIPKIYQMNVKSQVSHRYANTTISSKVKNAGSTPQEASFSVVVPETALISGFVMEVDGKNYTAYVKEKEEAQKAYATAIASGLGAAHVFVSDSNRFTVSVNVEPETKAAFYLNYEELLKREDGHYELVINLHPGQPVKDLDLNVEVDISESRKIINLKAPPIRSAYKIGNGIAELDPRATIEVVNDTAAVVRFIPSLDRQNQLATILGTEENQGLAGQFVVQYDVERDPKGGEVLVQDGYFVHFFAPSDISPLSKHIVFVFDTSYSMVGEKIVQLKEAMSKILGELKDHDLFNLVEFNTNVKVWNLDNTNDSVWYPTENKDSLREGEVEEDISNYTFPNAYKANPDNIEKAKTAVTELEPNRGTDIHNALSVGLHLIEMTKMQNNGSSNPQPMIVFLTDGDPTIGITSPEEIITRISKYNSESTTTPIFALSFGDGADKNFLQKLSLRNSGFLRYIYESADASLQLQDFYRQISSPLLSNVSFKYEPTTTSLTKTEFPIHFGGSELVVAGWCGTDAINPSVEGWGIDGNIHFTPVVERPVSNIERLWAYLTVKQLLEKKEAADKDQDELKKKTLDLALKYSFVTPVSSLVVVKQNDTNSVDTETAAKEPGAACPKYPKGYCTYEEECPASNRHGLCGADKNYKSLVCCTSSGTTKILRYWDIRDFPDITQCGRSGVLNQTYNGDRTEIGEYPWMAALLYVATKNTTYGGVKCGGTLITEKFVLTAAHCVIDQTAESIRVLLGDWNITSDPDPYPAGQCKTSRCTAKTEYADKVINATIAEIISHPYYSPKTKRDDIALLRLKTPVHFTDYVRPICIPTDDLPALTSEDEVFVAGWGITETGSQSDILLKATLHVLTDNECLEKIQKTGGIHETEFCAANGDSDACGGDSVGPLMGRYKDYRSNWFLLGIVESGPSCRLGATATVYTRVSSFVNWMRRRVASESERDSPCITPDNRNGSCVPVDQCPVVEQQLLQPGSSSEVEFIRRSLCGFDLRIYDLRDMVCCRPTQLKIERDSSCRTPDNKNGSCLLVEQCPVLEQQLLQPGSSSEVEFIGRSLCGWHDKTRAKMFCCRLSQVKTENAMEGSSCETPEPESKDGRCVRITNCPALKNASKAAGEHIQKYQCGFDIELLVCCKTQDIVVASEPKYLEEFSSANIPNRTICGQIRSNNTKSEYPWLAALMYSTNSGGGYDLVCGGSLINKRFVFTAASCFDDGRILNWRVLLGTGITECDKTSNCPSSMQNLSVEQAIRHPFYHMSDHLNDIALVRLGSDVVFNDYVSPICLPPPNLQPLRNGSEFTVAGWTTSNTAYVLDQRCVDPNVANIGKQHEQEVCISTINDTVGIHSKVRGGSITRAYKDQLGQNVFLEGIDRLCRDCARFNRWWTKNVRISAYTSWILRTITETT